MDEKHPKPSQEESDEAVLGAYGDEFRRRVLERLTARVVLFHSETSYDEKIILRILARQGEINSGQATPPGGGSKEPFWTTVVIPSN